MFLSTVEMPCFICMHDWLVIQTIKDYDGLSVICENCGHEDFIASQIVFQEPDFFIDNPKAWVIISRQGFIV